MDQEEKRHVYWDSHRRKGMGAWVLVISRGHQTVMHEFSERLLETERDKAEQLAESVTWKWQECVKFHA